MAIDAFQKGSIVLQAVDVCCIQNGKAVSTCLRLNRPDCRMAEPRLFKAGEQLLQKGDKSLPIGQRHNTTGQTG